MGRRGRRLRTEGPGGVVPGGASDLGRLDDLSTLVLATVRADPVRELSLVAVGADGESRRGKGVVRAALVASGLGVPAFRIRHGWSCRCPTVTERDCRVRVLGVAGFFAQLLPVTQRG
jgi:hypothetical protein